MVKMKGPGEDTIFASSKVKLTILILLSLSI